MSFKEHGQLMGAVVSQVGRVTYRRGWCQQGFEHRVAPHLPCNLVLRMVTWRQAAGHPPLSCLTHTRIASCLPLAPLSAVLVAMHSDRVYRGADGNQQSTAQLNTARHPHSHSLWPH